VQGSTDDAGHGKRSGGDDGSPATRNPLGHPRGMLIAALVIATVSAVSAAGAGGPGSGGTETSLQDAAAAASAGSSAATFSVAPAGPIVLPAQPALVEDPAPSDPVAITGLAANGIPNVALNAYRVAAGRMATSQPDCGIDWSLLAGIGRVESNHGRYGGAVLNDDGTSTPQIIGPPLDGGQFAFISDSDDGRFDGDSSYDRAVGPMQFIPGTWRAYGIDADGNGTTDPLDVDDAALAAAHYLCVAGGDLRTDAGKRRAVLAYNHSDSYVAQVLALAAAYAAGLPVADLPLVGDTTSPVPAPGPFGGGPAAPGPALGAGDTTSSPEGQPTVLPAPAAPADAGSQPAPAEAQPAESPAGGGGTGGSTGTIGTGAGTGGNGGNQPPAAAAPSQAPAPVLPPVTDVVPDVLAPVTSVVPVPPVGEVLPELPVCKLGVLPELVNPACRLLG